MSQKFPAFQFYPGDWMKDPNLRRCSHAAKGVWIDMLCLMWECDDRGMLSTAGRCWDDQEIVLAVGGDSALTAACLRELVEKGVASRTTAGAIYSRRMVRDEQIRQHRVSAGQAGGEAKASKQASKTLAKGVAKGVAKSGSSSSSSSSTSVPDSKPKSGKEIQDQIPRAVIESDGDQPVESGSNSSLGASGLESGKAEWARTIGIGRILSIFGDAGSELAKRLIDHGVELRDLADAFRDYEAARDAARKDARVRPVINPCGFIVHKLKKKYPSLGRNGGKKCVKS